MQDQFDDFSDNFEFNADSIAANIIFYKFSQATLTLSAGMVQCNEVNYDGSRFDGLTDQFCLQQLIDELTHIIQNSISCIDLSFTNKPNL